MTEEERQLAHLAPHVRYAHVRLDRKVRMAHSENHSLLGSVHEQKPLLVILLSWESGRMPNSRPTSR